VLIPTAASVSHLLHLPRSRFDNRWQGVPAAELLALATPKPDARFALRLQCVTQ